ncbi:hypothetical protein HW555_013568 [Spodoptera exigua]|uniref:PiggyBac transposable element-derived protein domain-containing protein n=1 Tax=Spodoptera exigua TaxID=7107 RepID=A0A835KZP0_SPOEX|nr:hypothetical protein HW555_013568 [Spodoptera exigua]
MVWRNTNRVAMISTYHGNSQQTTRESTKPILILDYNIMMGGVDKKDQLLAMYPVERKRTRAWYKKIFKRLLNNKYYKHTTSPQISPAHTQNKTDVSHRLSVYPKGTHQHMRRSCSNAHSCDEVVTWEEFVRKNTNLWIKVTEQRKVPKKLNTFIVLNINSIVIWDRQIMEHIASETNRYAQQVASQMSDNYNLFPRSRITRRYDTAVDELYVYFVLVMVGGILGYHP